MLSVSVKCSNNLVLVDKWAAFVGFNSHNNLIHSNNSLVDLNSHGNSLVGSSNSNNSLQI